MTCFHHINKVCITQMVLWDPKLSDRGFVFSVQKMMIFSYFWLIFGHHVTTKWKSAPRQCYFSCAQNGESWTQKCHFSCGEDTSPENRSTEQETARILFRQTNNVKYNWFPEKKRHLKSNKRVKWWILMELKMIKICHLQTITVGSNLVENAPKCHLQSHTTIKNETITKKGLQLKFWKTQFGH